jgi:type IV pilus assembly protein PilW
VELMVSMVIGMIAVIVMMQVFSVSEGYKRTATSSGDAQSTGAIALYGLQRDLQQSGYGFASPLIMGCSVTVAGGATISAVAPVTINHASVPAGDANTDTLLVAYGNSNNIPAGDRVTARAGTTGFRVASPSGFVTGDRVIFAVAPDGAARATNCGALALETNNDADATDSIVTVPTGTAGTDLGVLINLGSAPRIAAYAVRSGRLTVCDFMATNCADATKVGDTAVWVPIADNVVSLRAQYGRDTTASMDATVDVFDKTTPDTGTPTGYCNWMRTTAVRLALVVRATAYDKEVVTAAAPTWAGSGTAGSAISLPGTDWGHYRYKVFETVVPLRNMTWAATQEAEEGACT